MKNQSEEHVFGISQRHAQEHALAVLSSDLYRVSFIVQASDHFFWTIGGGIVCMSLGFLWLAVSLIHRGDSSEALSVALVSLFYLGGLYVLYRIRRHRRAMLPEFTRHYAQEMMTFTVEGIEYKIPVGVSYPPDTEARFGRCRTEVWRYSNVERLSVYRTTSGRVTALDVMVAGEPEVLTHFDNKESLVETLKDSLPSYARVEENPQLIPVWVRTFMWTLAVAGVAFFIWILSLA